MKNTNATTPKKHLIALTSVECVKIKQILNDVLNAKFKEEQTDENLNEIEDLLTIRNKFRKFTA